MGFIPPHGGYRSLVSYRKAEVVYDITVHFCARFLERRDRTVDQMVQAARSGKQNIAEGSQASGTSTETEIKLTNVARASLEELLVDYEDYLRVHGLRAWPKSSPEARYIRNLAVLSFESVRAFCETRSARGDRQHRPLPDPPDQLPARPPNPPSRSRLPQKRRHPRAHVKSPQSHPLIGLIGPISPISPIRRTPAPAPPPRPQSRSSSHSPALPSRPSRNPGGNTPPGRPASPARRGALRRLSPRSR